MNYEITPDPDEAEREAILAALAADEADRQPLSAWARGVLPEQGGEEDRP